MEVHDLALFCNNRQAHLVEGSIGKWQALLSFKTNKCYIIAGIGQRSADTYHALIIVQVIGNSTDYSFWLH